MSIVPIPYQVDVDRKNFEIEIWQRSQTKRRYILKEKIKCAIGTEGHDTPAGRYEIYAKKLNPSWTVPNTDWAKEKGLIPGTVIPGGVFDNPLRGAFLAIVDDPTGNVGIHGTRNIDSIGTRASHGCIRVEEATAIRLYHKLPKYTPVHIY
jgi:lipoprotein-anchoring transpeptidase ErfK/SrfK